MSSSKSDEECLQFSWHDFYSWRHEAAERFGNHRTLPFIAPYEEIQGYVTQDSHILDVGAGVARQWRTIAKSDQQYFTMDVDPKGSFDYRTFDDIPSGTNFDLILMNQLLEHLTVSDAFGLVEKARAHLSSTGVLVATIPNTAHPVRQWTADHATAWAPYDLYGLFRSCGYEVIKVARYGKKALVKNVIRRFIIRVVCDQFRIDWADSILLVATCGGSDRRRQQLEEV